MSEYMGYIKNVDMIKLLEVIDGAVHTLPHLSGLG